MDLHLALYTTLKNFELHEGVRREDFSFDAFFFFSEKLGYKSCSSLRKMCEPRSENNGSKLGLEEAARIIAMTGDHRLEKCFTEMIQRFEQEKQQMEIFDKEAGDEG